MAEPPVKRMGCGEHDMRVPLQNEMGSRCKNLQLAIDAFGGVVLLERQAEATKVACADTPPPVSSAVLAIAGPYWSAG